MGKSVQLNSAIYMLLQKDGKYLFSKRQNTGYMDGFYSLPAGHVEPNEGPSQTVIREAKEELGIVIEKADVSFAHVQYAGKTDDSGEWLYTYFTVTRWQGEIENCEPEKCEELVWLTEDEINPLIEQNKIALEAINNGIQCSEIRFNVD